jgi:carboxymethylenebutenolidase
MLIDLLKLERKLERMLVLSNKNSNPRVWPGVGHAFMNQDRPEVYNAEIATQALDEVTKWFK